MIGNASFFQSQQIPANNEVLIFFTIRLMPLGIVNELIRAWQNKDWKFDVQLRGNMNVDNLQLPVNLQYSIGK
jgi:hypothetical protein